MEREEWFTEESAAFSCNVSEKARIYLYCMCPLKQVDVIPISMITLSCI